MKEENGGDNEEGVDVTERLEEIKEDGEDVVVDVEAAQAMTTSESPPSRERNPEQPTREKSVRFHPDMMYCRRSMVSRRQIFQKAQTVVQREMMADDDDDQNGAEGRGDTQTSKDHNRSVPSFSTPHDSTRTSEYVTSRECYVQVVTGLRDAMDPKLRRRKEFSHRTLKGLDETAAELGRNTQYRLVSIGGGQTREQMSYDPSKIGFFGKLGFSAYVHWSYKTSFLNVFLSLTMIFYALVTFFGLLIYAVGVVQPECLYVGSLDRDFKQAGSYFVDAFAVSWTTFSTVGYGIAGPQLSLHNEARCFLVNMFTAMEAFLGVLFAGAAGAITLGKIMRYNAIAPVTWSDPLILKYGSGLSCEEKLHSMNNENGDDGLQDCESGVHPFPVLEFRVANHAFARDGGELANVSVSAWARILAKNATKELRDAAKMAGMDYRRLRRLRREQQIEQQKQKQKYNMQHMGQVLKTVGGKATYVGKKVGGTASSVGKTVGGTAAAVGKKMGSVGKKVLASPLSMSSKGGTSVVEDTAESRHSLGDPFYDSGPMTSSHRSNPANFPNTVESGALDALIPTVPVSDIISPQTSPGVVMMDDGEYADSCGLSHPTIYSRLALETECHPFFKRCWHLRHKIDEHSPLLDGEAHHIIRGFRNGGGKGWPPQLNSHEKLRQHLCFEEISVTLSGTDHITGNTVYGTSLYTTFDLVIGYQFANVLMKHPKTGLVGVDLSLIHDVLEQHGGGGEPLADEEENELGPPVDTVNFRTPPTGNGGTSELSLAMKEE